MGAIIGALRDEDGAVMIEYALMLIFIAVVCCAAVGIIGQVTAGKYGTSWSGVP